MKPDRRVVVVVDDDEALAAAVADSFLEVAARALADRGRFGVALAGGSTPKAAYGLLAAAPRRAALDWTRVRFFFGDERCVPPDDDESNYKTARRTLLEPLDIAPAAVFRMRGEDEPGAAARAYADILRKELPDAGGAPAFDLIMLGMGPDGHTASLFPGTDPYADDDLLVRAPYVPNLGAFRITLTPRVLCAARRVAVATAGPGKAAALSGVFDGPFEPARYPVQVVAPRAGTLVWLVDRAAAAALRE